MKIERIRIVTSAKIDLTSPTPMSESVCVASPIFSGSFFASSSIVPVMS